MTREGFSEMLVTIRETTGISKSDFARKIGWMPSDLYKIENATTSYNINKIITYLSGLNLVLMLSSNCIHQTISNSEDFAKWLKQEIEISENSIAIIADSICVSSKTIGRIIKHESKISIDLLLKLIDYFGYTIEFKPIQQ